jgi:hypothetical protein
MLKMGGQGPEDSLGGFLRHGQARKIKSQPLKILWNAGQGAQACLDVGIGFVSENQAAKQGTACQFIRVGQNHGNSARI